MTKQNQFLTLFCLVYSLALLWISAHNFISHSEFWSITLAQKFGSTSFESVAVYYKPLFYALLKPLYWLPLDNWGHTQMARCLFGGIAGLSFGVWLFNLHRIFKNQWLILLYGLFLLSFQVYFYNSYRVRSDMLANLIAIFIFSKLTWQYQSNQIPKAYDLKLLCLFLLLIMATPKAIYLAFTLQTYYFILFRNKLSSSDQKLTLALFGAFPLALCLFVSAMSFEIGWLVENPYAHVVQYHLNSFSSFFDQATWNHVFTSLKVNAFNYVLILAGFVVFFRDADLRKNPQYQALVGVSILALALILIHPDKWTYFIAQWVPWLSLPCLFVFQKVQSLGQKTLLVGLAIVIPFGLTNATSYFTPNSSQKHAIKRLEPLFEQIPKAMYMDSTGLFPRENVLLSFLGPNDTTGKTYALQNIKRNKPEFIFFTTKMNRAAPEIYEILFKDYQVLEPDVWVLKSKRSLINWAPKSPPPSLRALFIFDYLPRTQF